MPPAPGGGLTDCGSKTPSGGACNATCPAGSRGGPSITCHAGVWSNWTGGCYVGGARHSFWAWLRRDPTSVCGSTHMRAAATWCSLASMLLCAGTSLLYLNSRVGQDRSSRDTSRMLTCSHPPAPLTPKPATGPLCRSSPPTRMCRSSAASSSLLANRAKRRARQGSLARPPAPASTGRSSPGAADALAQQVSGGAANWQ